jgi:predicted GNAT family acetyltransferase
MKLWAKYIKEREGKEIIEHDYGFAVYKINEEKTCYIEHIYVDDDFRGKGLASVLCEEQ